MSNAFQNMNQGPPLSPYGADDFFPPSPSPRGGRGRPNDEPEEDPKKKIEYWTVERQSPKVAWDPVKKKKISIQGTLTPDLPATQYTPDKIASAIQEKYGGGSYSVYACNKNGQAIDKSNHRTSG